MLGTWSIAVSHFTVTKVLFFQVSRAIHKFAQATMWGLNLSRLLKRLGYQQAASIGDDVFNEVTSNSSPLWLSSNNAQKAV